MVASFHLFVGGHLHELGILQPPHSAGVEPCLGFRPELVTMAPARLYRFVHTPLARSVARLFIPQVGAMVHRPGEHALSWRFHEAHARWRPEAIRRSAHERLNTRDLGVAQAVKLR